MIRNLLGGIGALCAALVTGAAGAQDPSAPMAQPEAAVAPAYDKDHAHAYVGFGLSIASSRFSEPLANDIEASGGGLVAHGAGHSSKVNPSLDIGFTGQVALMSRTFEDNIDEETGDFLIEVDGGMRLSDLFYVSLGYTTQAIGYKNANLTETYGVIPVGAGILMTRESGYTLVQLRLGGGNLTNDQNNDADSVKYGGIRAVCQQGFGSGVQFMVALGLDRYTPRKNVADDYIRLDFGLGFGL